MVEHRLSRINRYNIVEHWAILADIGQVQGMLTEAKQPDLPEFKVKVLFMLLPHICHACVLHMQRMCLAYATHMQQI